MFIMKIKNELLHIPHGIVTEISLRKNGSVELWLLLAINCV